MTLSFSFIVPVYNRPEEIQELLDSLAKQTYKEAFEVVIIEDGSTLPSDKIIAEFQDRLQLTYLKKENTGPGDSRNYGMERAQGNYCIILDSDCIVPPKYLDIVAESLQKDFIHCFGGPDAAHPSFSALQKAINYSMTSLFTTGGIRGKKKGIGKFQPRSFNMGLCKEAYKASAGFGNIHPGEDPDLSFRLWDLGYNTRLIPEAYVFHKRRINWSKFHTQVKKFGMVRPILTKWHPQTAKITYWFPTLFSIGCIAAITIALLATAPFSFIPLAVYGLYLLLIFIDASIKNRSILIGSLAIIAAVIQFFGYGYGFLKSTILVNFSKKKPEKLFPKLFFKP